MKYDIITFGSATRDTFLRLKKENYRIVEDELLSKKDICFSLGSKIFIEDLRVASGGGGTNTACTFSKQGFKVAYCGKVGEDKRGEAVIGALKKFRVDTIFVKKDKKYLTAYSAILSLPHEERTILIYRGACHFMKKEDIPWEKIKETKWFYLAPLSEKSALIFPTLVEFARKNKIKIVSNPGSGQINLPKEILNSTLEKIDILILNREEASLLTKIQSKDDKDFIKKLWSVTPAIIVITKGKEGSVVSDGKYIYRAGVPSVLPFEKTGAGDAFGSGFLSGLLEKNSIEYAIQLATANATSCIQKIGAKNGLLKKGQWGSWPRVKVEKRKL